MAMIPEVMVCSVWPRHNARSSHALARFQPGSWKVVCPRKKSIANPSFSVKLTDDVGSDRRGLPQATVVHSGVGKSIRASTGCFDAEVAMLISYPPHSRPLL